MSAKNIPLVGRPGVLILYTVPSSYSLDNKEASTADWSTIESETRTFYEPLDNHLVHTHGLPYRINEEWSMTRAIKVGAAVAPHRALFQLAWCFQCATWASSTLPRCAVVHQICVRLYIATMRTSRNISKLSFPSGIAFGRPDQFHNYLVHAFEIILALLSLPPRPP